MMNIVSYIILGHYICGLSTATKEFSCPSVFVSVSVCVYMITKKNQLGTSTYCSIWKQLRKFRH